MSTFPPFQTQFQVWFAAVLGLTLWLLHSVHWRMTDLIVIIPRMWKWEENASVECSPVKYYFPWMDAFESKPDLNCSSNKKHSIRINEWVEWLVPRGRHFPNFISSAKWRLERISPSTARLQLGQQFPRTHWTVDAKSKPQHTGCEFKWEIVTLTEHIYLSPLSSTEVLSRLGHRDSSKDNQAGPVHQT